jgi:hypothetical protein
VREALVVLWEASDRVCSKRLMPMIPVLPPALERHGQLAPGEGPRAKLLAVGPATIDRLLSEARIAAAQGRRRRAGFGSAARRSVPGLEVTRSRAHRKTDRPWVERKNGAIVRRLADCGRLGGRASAETLARLGTCHPDRFADAHLRTFQRAVKARQEQQAKRAIRRATEVLGAVPTPASPRGARQRSVTSHGQATDRTRSPDRLTPSPPPSRRRQSTMSWHPLDPWLRLSGSGPVAPGQPCLRARLVADSGWGMGRNRCASLLAAYQMPADERRTAKGEAALIPAPSPEGPRGTRL